MAHNAIVVNKEGVVIDGNQRFRACVSLNWTHIPAHVVDYDLDTEERWVYQSNIPAGRWDWEFIGNNKEPEELQGWGMPIPWSKEQEDKPEKLKPCKHCDKMIP